MTWATQAKQYEQALINDLNQIIRIPSVLDVKTQTPQTPFGIDMIRALSQMEAFASRDGFRYGRVDNMVTWIEFGPQDAIETVGILTHIDVVPAGDGWLRPAFNPEILDGLYFGRGAADMKADLMSAYYAIKMLADQNRLLKRKIRLIIGTDEENGWRDIPRYIEQEGEPTLGFSPDGAFPVINGEKAFQTVQLRFPSISNGTYILERFISGNRPNVVPGEAKARIQVPHGVNLVQDFDNFLQQQPFLNGDAQQIGQTVKLSLLGVQAHGAYPADGKNAGTYLAHFLSHYDFGGDARAFLDFVGITIHQDVYAHGLGLAYQDAQMGDLTLNVGVMRYSNRGQGTILLNFRYPQGVNLQAVITQVQRHLNGLQATVNQVQAGMPPHLVPVEDELVRVLSDVYAKQTGQYLPPRTSNGGSYARLLKRGVAFGGQFPDLKVTSHQANENIPVVNLTKTMAIFAESLWRLCQ
ncbi:dipeptidase PepV [Weissella sagaensis]|jgi:dipeptidase D|uniref:dipeptidase PepV n=1 Tax=Weissella sagaensis TaxID=2559928 RepID=UPI00214C560A|nr:dipeptidase PepV [Weissella sagaensis]